jgi:hypothetical protein
MTQTMYAHMNKWINKQKRQKGTKGKNANFHHVISFCTKKIHENQIRIRGKESLSPNI